MPDSHTVQQLWGLQREILRVRVEFPSMTQQEIAAQVGCSPATVAKTLNSPSGRAHADQLQNRMDDQVRENQRLVQSICSDAINHLHGIMLDTEVSAATRARVAQDFLDRGGVPKVSKNELTVERNNVTKDDVDRIRAMAQQARLAQETRTITIESGESDDTELQSD